MNTVRFYFIKEYVCGVQFSQEISEEELALLVEVLNASELDMAFWPPKYLLIGPKPHTTSPWSSNCMQILRNSGIDFVKKIERFTLEHRIFNDEMDEKNAHDVSNYNYDKLTEECYFDWYDMFNENYKRDSGIQNHVVPLANLEQVNVELGLGMDEHDLKYYRELYKSEGRDPNVMELLDLSQSNSEHSRHWIFNGNIHLHPPTMSCVDSGDMCKTENGNITMFNTVKNTLQANPNNSALAFCDNASAISGYEVETLTPDSQTHRYSHREDLVDISLTAETHNFPTGICPFHGANTGVGGRIRDTLAIGRGGTMGVGTAGYSMSDNEFGYNMLVTASDGASDYGNKIGEPIVSGFCRTYTNEELGYDWKKPIMFTAGIGLVKHSNLIKEPAQHGMLVVRVGGPAYKIGIGGGVASSRGQTSKNSQSDMGAVQRGDPEMENKVSRVIRTLVEMDKNPIVSIHDQGAGGMANVTKEIMEPIGGDIYLNRVNRGDSTMTPTEVWIAEYQEQMTMLIKPESRELVENVCAREKVPVEFVGVTNGSGYVRVFENEDGNKTECANFNLQKVLGKMPQKNYYFPEEMLTNGNESESKTSNNNSIPSLTANNFINVVKTVLSHPSVCSKRFLTNKVDRCVTGLVAQQQCVGYDHIPLSDYAVMALSHNGYEGVVTAVGEQPIKGIIDPTQTVQMVTSTIIEMLTNIVWAEIDGGIESIKCSANWMCAPKLEGEGFKLYKAVQYLSKCLTSLGIAIDGGKDSMSMFTKRDDGKITKCPPTLVLTGYAPMKDIRMKITPGFKEAGNLLYFIPFVRYRNGYPLAGTVFEYLHRNNLTGIDWGVDILMENGIPEECFYWWPNDIKHLFMYTQKLIKSGVIVSGHDISDGGLITALCEMGFAGNKGYRINIIEQNYLLQKNQELLNSLTEIPGIVIEIKPEHEELISGYGFTEDVGESQHFVKHKALLLGKVVKHNDVSIRYSDSHEPITTSLTELKKSWEEGSLKFENMRIPAELAQRELNSHLDFDGIENHVMKQSDTLYRLDEVYGEYELWWKIHEKSLLPYQLSNYSVAILREEGSNSDREMANAFYMAGFDVMDVNMHDIKRDPKILRQFRGIAFVGGFSYSDVLGSASGWYNCIVNNKEIKDEFDAFYARYDTFSLGVCNGCQLMVRLGWVKGYKLEHNTSGRFECRFPIIQVVDNDEIPDHMWDSLFLHDLENVTFGIWSAHGEGRFVKDETISDEDRDPVLGYYVNPNGSRCSELDYPHNPSGSVNGIAMVGSANGRHMAIMPHPERSFLSWQIPWDNVSNEHRHTVWFGLFYNAYKWCEIPLEDIRF